MIQNTADYYAPARAADALVAAAAARCGHDNRNIGMAGEDGATCCYDCYQAAQPLLDASRAEWRAARKVANAAMRETGLAYWAGRGLTPGAAVYQTGSHIFGPFTVTGTAKVGANGAYVSCPKRCGNKQLDPRYWRNAR